jgi:hypothetical protein
MGPYKLSPIYFLHGMKMFMHPMRRLAGYRPSFLANCQVQQGKPTLLIKRESCDTRAGSWLAREDISELN